MVLCKVWFFVSKRTSHCCAFQKDCIGSILGALRRTDGSTLARDVVDITKRHHIFCFCPFSFVVSNLSVLVFQLLYVLLGFSLFLLFTVSFFRFLLVSLLLCCLFFVLLCHVLMVPFSLFFFIFHLPSSVAPLVSFNPSFCFTSSPTSPPSLWG